MRSNTESPEKRDNHRPINQDRRLVRFIGRHGAASIGQVIAATGMAQPTAYRRVAACIEGGLLERRPVLSGGPSLLIATREGLRYAGLGLPVAVVTPGGVDHLLRSVSLALDLSSEFADAEILSERELVFAERTEGRPIASAQVGKLPSGAPRLHRPDLAILTAAETIAIELELSPKAPRRLEAIMRGWRRAQWVGEVRYYASAGITRRAVERAIERTYATDRVRLLEASA